MLRFGCSVAVAELALSWTWCLWQVKRAREMAEQAGGQDAGPEEAPGPLLALEDREEPVVLSMQPGRSAAAAEQEPAAARHMAAFHVEDDEDGMQQQ